MSEFTFYVAETEEEYAILDAFRQVQGDEVPLRFPTIYGLDNEGHLLGYSTTRFSEDGIPLGGPLVTDPKFKPRYVFSRQLLFTYLATLKHLGLTFIIFDVLKSNQRMFQAVCAEGFKPYTHDEENWWFRIDFITKKE